MKEHEKPKPKLWYSSYFLFIINFMEVGFYPATEGKIINNPDKPFLLISLMGDTFLLTKTKHSAPFEKNIHF